MHGECMVLAMTLAVRYGIETVGVHDDIWGNVPCHVAVITPEGSYADARGGGMGLSAFLSGWGPTAYVRPISQEAMRRTWGHRVMDWTASDDDLRTLGLDQRSLAAERPAMRPTSAGLQASNG